VAVVQSEGPQTRVRFESQLPRMAFKNTQNLPEISRPPEPIQEVKMPTSTTSCQFTSSQRSGQFTSSRSRLKRSGTQSILPRIVGRPARSKSYLGTSTKPVYTIEKLEALIYDNTHHDNDSMILMPEALMPVEGGKHTVPHHLIRCLTDVSAQYIDALMVLAVLGTCVTTPLTFIWSGTAWSSRLTDPWSARLAVTNAPGATFTFAFDFLMDLIYAGHLMSMLNTSYIDTSAHVEVVNRKMIRSHHFHDPMYWIRLLGTTSYIWILFGAPTHINNVKLVRILHFFQLPDSLWQVSASLAYHMFRPVLVLLACSHWVACVMSCFGGYREALEKDPQWFRTFFNGYPVSETLSAYLMVAIEALYMLTGCLDNPLGDGSPREKNFGSLLIVSFFGPLGCVGVAMFIASIVRAQALAHVLETSHANNKAFISNALNILNIPKELQRRVFSLHYFQRMSHDFEAFDHLFGRRHLSAPLESALRVYLYNESVLYARYFKDKDPSYILEVVRILQDCVFLPGDYVARCGEVGTQMYFVARGCLSVLVPHRRNSWRMELAHAEEVTKLGKGDYFGDVALLKDCTRTAWVRSDTYSILSMLARHAIEGIWKYFPQERMALIEQFKIRLNENRHTHAQKLWKKAGNNVSAGVKVAGALGRRGGFLQAVVKYKDIGKAEDSGELSGGGQSSAAGSSGRASPRAAASANEADKPTEIESADAHLPAHLPAGVPGEEQGADAEDIGMVSATMDEAEIMNAAQRVERTCQVLVSGHQAMERKMEALQRRVAELASNQEKLAILMATRGSPGKAPSPSNFSGSAMAVKTAAIPSLAVPARSISEPHRLPESHSLPQTLGSQSSAKVRSPGSSPERSISADKADKVWKQKKVKKRSPEDQQSSQDQQSLQVLAEECVLADSPCDETNTTLFGDAEASALGTDEVQREKDPQLQWGL